MKTLLLWLGLAGIAVCAQAQTQVAKTITGTNGQFIGFLEFKPSDYGSQKHPLIIFMHGIGERGNGTTDIQNITDNGIPNYCAHGAPMRFTVNGQTSSFVVLSPQLSTSYGAWPSWYVQEMINYAKANLSIDPNRIYVTGLSLGGGGVWTYAFESASNAAQVAAIAPVCGTDYGNDANACASAGATNLPIWAFHCEDDGTVAVGNLQHVQMTLNINCPSYTPTPRYTYYLSGGHSGAWINAYDTGHITRAVDSSQVKTGASTNVNFTAKPNIYEWFLMHTRSNVVTPVAVAGANQTITLPLATISLNGSGSYVSSGSITSYLWNFVSGPATPILSTPTLPVTAVVSLVAGTYTFQLTVTSNTGATSTSQVSVTVNGLFNQPPVASAGTNQGITLPTNVASLDGSGSKDPDGTISKYAWSQVSGPSTAVIATPSAAATQVSSLVQGTYTFQLMVTDNAGATNTALVTVYVNAGANQSPVANAGTNQTLTLPSNVASLDGSGSKDPDGTISKYAWSQSSGPSTSVIATPSASATKVSGLVQGTYTFQLMVTDNAGATNTALVTVYVNAGANQSPVANAGTNTGITLPTNVTSLDGSGSKDPDGSISNYAWSQVLGPSTAVIATPTAVATKVSGLILGTYTFQLKVTDNAGATNTALVTIYVNPGSNQSPVSNAGTNQAITLPTNSIMLDGTGSKDPDGTISKYAWSQVSGPSTAVIGSPAASQTLASSLVQGAYTFQLTVTDNGGATNTSLVTTTVNAGAALSASGSGLRGDYYNTMDLSGPIILTRTDPTVNFNWPMSPGTGVNSDNFSVRWSGQVLPQFSENYTFYTNSDDGIRVWVNGQEIINDWNVHASTYDNGSIALQAGVKYDIVIEYFENALSAVAQLWWSSPSTPKAFVPQSQLFPATGSSTGGTVAGTGLEGDYYNTMDLSGPIVLTRTDTTVNFNWPMSPGGNVNSDNFSTRWTGQVLPQYSETYTFYTNSDDGIRVWVNGQEIINDWTVHASTQDYGSIALQAGVKYNIVIEYFENQYSSIAQLYWSSPSTPKAIIPQSQLYPPSTAPVVTGTGLEGDYYNTMDLSGPIVLTRTDTTVNFNWPMSPGGNVNSDYFSVRWSGQVLPQFSETYTFYTNSDDGIRVWVNGQMVINDWTIHASTQDYGSISLQAGVKYNIVVEYFENAYSAIAQLYWSSPSTPKAIIPQSQLFPPAPNTAPVVTPGTGLEGDYYNTMDLSGAVILTRTDTTVNFNWPMSPGGNVYSDNFSVRWTGQVLPQYSETYTFYTNSDDGIRVWVNGQQIINDWTVHPSTQDYGSITLQAGVKYNIVIEYFENQYSAVAQLYWSSPSTPLSIIPKSQLFLPVTTTASSQSGGVSGTISMSSDNAQPLIVVKNGIVPNPVMGGQMVRLNFNSAKAAPGSVQVINSNGALVYNKQVSLGAGLNVNSIPTTGLARGFYIVNVISDGKRETYKLIIQ
ncbi:MAG TPA: PA14 domain-containing protein [Chitinophagaceae bacterium]